jgi:hypothetical protein
MDRTATLVGGQVIHNVHDPKLCEGRYCAVHIPSDHHMKDWDQHWRSDRAMMERICPHGVGHPDPDHMDYLLLAHGAEIAYIEGVHGCDGCCTHKH